MTIHILGGGAVTQAYYLPALARLGRLAETVVAEPDARIAAEIRAQWPALDLRVEDYAACMAGLPDDPAAPPRVIVALPNRLHVVAARLALERGAHVLCEKPLALAGADCDALAALAAERGRRLKVAMSRRYLPALKLAREMVAAGELGAVTAVEVFDCTPFLWRPKSYGFFARDGGGILADMGVHYLDFVETLVGPLTPLAYQDDARGGVESTAGFRLTAGEVAVTMRLSRLEDRGGFVRIACAGGEIRVDKADERSVMATPAGRPARRVSVEAPFDSPDWPCDFNGAFCQLLADFERAVAGAATPLADVTDAARTARLIEWAYAQRPPRPASKRAAAKPSLVTGATGFIGDHLVGRLADEGEPVRASVRRPETCAGLARHPADLVPTDLLDPTSVRRAAEGCRVVYHLAYGQGPDARRVTVEGAKNVVEAAIAAGAECVVVLSTMYVFGFPHTPPEVDESFPYRPYGGEYGTSKAAMERWCLARARTSGATRIVVLNPTCVFGPGGGAYTTLPADLAAQGRFAWIDGGEGVCNYAYVENLADAIRLAAETEAAHGQRFIINDGWGSWRQVLGPLVDAPGRTIASVSAAELKALNRAADPFRVQDLLRAVLTAREVRTVAGRSAALRWLVRRTRLGAVAAAAPGASPHAAPPAVPPDWLGDLYSPARSVFSARKAETVLGWRPRVGLAEAQRITRRWLEETGRVPPACGTAP